jgi:methylphosphotriester-DNA--protein-cysteine methyltransferase
MHGFGAKKNLLHLTCTIRSKPVTDSPKVPIAEDLPDEETMTDEQLDAELRSYGIDPDQLLQQAFQKVCELARAQAKRIARAEAALEALQQENAELTKCASCKKALSRDCENCQRLWAS